MRYRYVLKRSRSTLRLWSTAAEYVGFFLQDALRPTRPA